MTGTSRIQTDFKKYTVAIIMMVFLCGLALTGRAQISKLDKNGQITVEETDEEASEQSENEEDKETAEKITSPPSKKVKPSDTAD